ncbi:MAG: photosystem II biogenesis protein Psp29 [Gomphosphaeria aponina SAG 52.96 = DSM 107014]|uniref:Protein Thf1 n=1 Tax=Gomphosphaeria aponina SAG 52.96 = DSM 107014 TaxID=1521640 RepID=A0A941JSD2_9CHRO|nr:photosystem II biogenesis protein Psp29 [Gomphosphaeria aponina SAG 52.96 = DSM 107014]
MEKLRTVSDTKRDFYSHHKRPINSVYRRVVEELLVEMHLLSVNVDFRPDPIYYLGVVSSFESFMQGYKPEEDKESIFTALCQSVGDSPGHYRACANNALTVAQKMGEQLVSWIIDPTPIADGEGLLACIQGIKDNAKFKYSRLFAIGLYTLLQNASEELVTDVNRRHEALNSLSAVLHLPEEKLEKDLEVYRSNLEKMAQMLTMLKDVMEADRKKREERSQQKTASE